MRGGQVTTMLAGALFSLLLLPALVSARGGCPFAASVDAGNGGTRSSRALLGYDLAAFNKVDFVALKADVLTLLTNSQAFWPADFGNYGPFLIRLAWHCNGSYRVSDGRGGCDGARQRFEPERSWQDNTNLDKARALLAPLKMKYGPGLSWGDLIVFAATTAIESMGGPVLGFCGGRMDDVDGTDSIQLGPSPEQQAIAPCAVNGACVSPLGTTTVGLIYVNPAGPMGNSDPVGSAAEVRSTFARMGMNDTETVTLIGGAHSFGKVHGACPGGAGPNPDESPASPWPGTCGNASSPDFGKGNNTYTSGFEGSWTRRPTQWTNDYFNHLLDYTWVVENSTGGSPQWRPSVQNTSHPVPGVKNIMMLTTDIAFISDPVYIPVVVEFAANISKLEDEFAHAWYKLVSRDMGPATRCLGNNVPPPQPFQYPLPAPPTKLANFAKVKAAITTAISTASSALPADTVAGKPYYGAVFATLAWRCASTFRGTDYLGGCNGARIRFAPEANWTQNVDMDKALDVLAPVKARFGASLTYADLIVLAGTTAVELSGAGLATVFCGGRSDATDGNGSVYLQPRTIAPASLPGSAYMGEGAGTTLEYSSAWLELVAGMQNMRLDPRELVALQANLRSPLQQLRLGYSGTWTSDSSLTAKLSNAYFKALLLGEWQKSNSTTGMAEYMAVETSAMMGGTGGTVGGAKVYMMPSDLVLKYNPIYLAIAQEYASDYLAFEVAFKMGWTKMMNADRFDGPAGSVCP